MKLRRRIKILVARTSGVFRRSVKAEPAFVPVVIQALWADQRVYEAQVERGFAFVQGECNPALVQSEREDTYRTTRAQRARCGKKRKDVLRLRGRTVSSTRANIGLI